jgi:hypothetical protein
MAEDERQQSVRDAVSLLLKQLVEAGKSIVIVQSNPRPNVNIPRLFARKVNNGEELPENYGYDRRYFESQVELSYSIMQEAASIYSTQQVRLVHPEMVLCDSEVCKVIMDNEIMFSDDNHLSVYGSAKVAIPIVESVSQMLSE